MKIFAKLAVGVGWMGLGVVIGRHVLAPHGTIEAERIVLRDSEGRQIATWGAQPNGDISLRMGREGASGVWLEVLEGEGDSLAGSQLVLRRKDGADGLIASSFEGGAHGPNSALYLDGLPKGLARVMLESREGMASGPCLQFWSEEDRLVSLGAGPFSREPYLDLAAPALDGDATSEKRSSFRLHTSPDAGAVAVVRAPDGDSILLDCRGGNARLKVEDVEKSIRATLP
jgi:hypothetical protein